jgi:gamma-glutamyl AIG2-like cyclotransferase
LYSRRGLKKLFGMVNNPRPAVATFFYGSYMNPDVLREVEIDLRAPQVARLSGYELTIRPRANLTRSDRHVAWGVVAELDHRELERLYAHASDVLGECYLPEAVLVEHEGGRFRPALCYLCHSMVPRPAETAYVERVAAPARALALPAWYIAHIESFAP